MGEEHPSEDPPAWAEVHPFLEVAHPYLEEHHRLKLQGLLVFEFHLMDLRP